MSSHKLWKGKCKKVYYIKDIVERKLQKGNYLQYAIDNFRKLITEGRMEKGMLQIDCCGKEIVKRKLWRVVTDKLNIVKKNREIILN